ncbi:energy transducer TonB [Testudinibacter sp. TR-2022]|uniref:TonB family protein n=1 Tax=Testudinibacter sp. TR-2022 TaxID=2585029 RepID=UPI00111B06DE|nr:energy transducer TonB [Testudinibacter sp. TR-2022]TNH05539.1 energy transducer TonB [Pasteurellaceae bacterium Phil31]TNH11571.1 energy transducer TonB [Testudinibacter sp. TR-2022]TNH11938.1 energy transducer TonB [Testudinibacter sp. TR-2022]TNH12636.1 energy transducer TonB [Testudinibacter sp. TR-2022]TNH18048.1 energy transducer TonB [Testudinibacter sp. TR-2022]
MIVDIPSLYRLKKYRIWLFNTILVCAIHFFIITFIIKKTVTVIPQASAAVIVNFSDPPQSIISIEELPLGPPQVITQDSQILDADNQPEALETPQLEENPIIENAEIIVKAKLEKKPLLKQQPQVKKQPDNNKKAKKPSDIESTATGQTVTAPANGNDQQIAAEYNSEGNSKTIITSWQALLRGHLGRYKRYPENALKQKIEGKPIVSVEIDRLGTVLKVTLKKSSQHQALDQEAINTLYRASPLPKPPEEIIRQKTTLRFSLPIDFEIENKAHR